MCIRKIALGAMLLGVTCGQATARDIQDYAGTWVNDNLRSTWSDGHYPTGRMKLELRVALRDGHMIYHSVNATMPNKPPAVIDFDAATDGKAYPLSGSDRYDRVRVRPLENNQIEILELKGDDVVVGAIWQLQDDGRTLMRWGLGKSPAGKSKAYQEFFRKT